jgi:hypothetical protein
LSPNLPLAPCAQVPNVFRNEYTLIDINDEGFVSGDVCAAKLRS